MRFCRLSTIIVWVCLIASATAATDIKSSVPSLSESQATALRALNIPVVVPTYVPNDFQVSEVTVNLCDANASVGPCVRREGADAYTIVYRNQQNNCLVVSAYTFGVGGGASEFESQIQTALLGDVFILFGTAGGNGNQTPTPSELASFPPLLYSFPAQVQSVGNSPYYSASVSPQQHQCTENTSITPLELEQIVQSFVRLD